MNWSQAVAAMLRGHNVVRASEQKRQLVGTAPDGLPIYDCGTEPRCVAAAWTTDDRPVMVFQGAETRTLFIPEDEERSATDWEISPCSR